MLHVNQKFVKGMCIRKEVIRTIREPLLMTV